ncbi:hypothetical protein BDQ17DRAFT_1432602 [Cyathus striatus]|nr:hypothetical protein BDQ17DRAFT_1432602 [Cyathus striatus]
MVPASIVGVVAHCRTRSAIPTSLPILKTSSVIDAVAHSLQLPPSTPSSPRWSSTNVTEASTNGFVDARKCRRPTHRNVPSYLVSPQHRLRGVDGHFPRVPHYVVTMKRRQHPANTVDDTPRLLYPTPTARPLHSLFLSPSPYLARRRQRRSQLPLPSPLPCPNSPSISQHHHHPISPHLVPRQPHLSPRRLPPNLYDH